jgi:hypothetical protein
MTLTERLAEYNDNKNSCASTPFPKKIGIYSRP